MNTRPVNFHHLICLIELEKMEGYLVRIEAMLDEDLRKMDEQFEEATKDMSVEDRDHYGDSLSDDYHLVAQDFPTLLRSSITLSVFASLENCLKMTCRYLRKTFNATARPVEKYKLKTEEGKPPELTRIQSYFMDIIGVEEFPSELEEWKKIVGVYRVIRNAFTHNDGVIKENEYSEFENQLNVLPVTIDKDMLSVKLHKDFGCQLIRDVDIFYLTLFNDLSPKYFENRMAKRYPNAKKEPSY